MGYTIYVVVLSAFTINFVGFRQGEDAFLLCFAAFACYTIVLDSSYYLEGEFLVVDNNGVARSCKSQFLQFYPLDHLCRDLVATCAKHASDNFMFGEEQRSWIGRVVTSAVIIVFKAAAVWYERRMIAT